MAQVVTQEHISDLDMKVAAMSNAIAWALYGDGAQEKITISDEDANKCKTAAYRCLEALQHLGVII